jgi:cytochrome d ubiquinol oxidase subunit II
MHLTTAWFAAIAFGWTGYFVLEGFDFGVGILLPLLGRDERQRATLLHTIGPLWDGNEVWLITAVGATFAAFPDWYATLLSGFYLPLLLILVALIVRGVALEYRGKRPEPAWRRRADLAIAAGSLVPALGWGGVFATVVRGVPLGATHDTSGSTWLLHPFALLGALTMLALFATHGALFLTLKTTGDLRGRARTLALRTGPPTAVLTAAFLAWMLDLRPRGAAAALAAAAVAGLLGALAATVRRRDGWAFAAGAAAIALTLAALFTALYPDVLPATDPAASLTVTNAAASPYTLKIMSWAAVGVAPIVLLYQGWTYWVFRKRVGAPTAPPPANPATPTRTRRA